MVKPSEKVVGLVLGVGAAITLFSVLVYNANNPRYEGVGLAPETQQVASTLNVTTGEIAGAFDSNPVQARSYYGGRTLTVEGAVQEITESKTDGGAIIRLVTYPGPSARPVVLLVDKRLIPAVYALNRGDLVKASTTLESSPSETIFLQARTLTDLTP